MNFQSAPLWRRNLFVCWFGVFATGLGLSQLAPILPLYIRDLGVTDPRLIARLSGLAFGATFIITAVFSPIWGYAADRFGRKPMLLRASLGMAVIIFCMGLVRNTGQLIALRFLQGIVAGYTTACTTLIATQTDREHAGWALGVLSTASVAGALLGPVMGGLLAEALGFRWVFFVTGGLLLVSFVTSLLFVRENFVRHEIAVIPMKEIWRSLPEKELTVTMFICFFVMTLALYSVEPVLTVFVHQISREGSPVALLSGLAFSASGLANLLAAPGLGKLSDRVGPGKILPVSLMAAGLLFIPQAFVTRLWQLVTLRFLLGLTMGGLNPALNTLIKRITPDALTGRIFGLNMAAGYLGVFVGAILGGQTAAWLGIRPVFWVTGALLLANALWVRLRVFGHTEP